MKNLHWWLALACVPLYGFWIAPYLSDSRPDLSRSIQVEKNEANRLAAELKELKSQQASLSTDSEAPATAEIPEILEQEYLLLDLRQITQGNGFSASGFNFTKGQNAQAEAAEIKVNFSAEGSRSNLLPLLRSIETNKRFMGLESLSISTVGGNPDSVRLSLNIYALAQRF